MTITFKASAAFASRLDALAEARGLNRSQAIRLAVLEASMAPEERARVPDRDELLRLLGESARSGSVAAMKTLLEELRRDGIHAEAPAGLSIIDQLARARRVSGRNARFSPSSPDAADPRQEGGSDARAR